MLLIVFVCETTASPSVQLCLVTSQNDGHRTLFPLRDSMFEFDDLRDQRAGLQSCHAGVELIPYF